MEEFLYKLTPTRQNFIKTMTSEEEATVGEHFSYLESLLKTGELILAGPCLDGSFGIVILRTESTVRAEEIMSGDPAVGSGVMSATLHPFRVSLIQNK